ncbi:hypothetical protein ACRAWF_28105 [Streptomyces sp. L7]
MIHFGATRTVAPHPSGRTPARRRTSRLPPDAGRRTVASCPTPRQLLIGGAPHRDCLGASA